MSIFLVRNTWDPFQLSPVGAEKESKRRCFQVAQYLVAVVVGLAVLTSAVVAKVGLSVRNCICATQMGLLFTTKV